jgi:thiamine pyrophosphokinase
VATVHTTYLCARVGCPLLLSSAHKQIVLQGFKYPLREFLMSSNFTGLNSNVAVPRAYTSVATVHTTYLCARVGCPLLLTSAHKQIILQGFKYPLREFLMSSNFTELNSNVAVPRAYTSEATVHTTYLCARVGCPLLLTSAHKQIVLQGLLPYGP